MSEHDIDEEFGHKSDSNIFKSDLKKSNKDHEYYKKRTEITKKYARQITEEFFPNEDVESSIECILEGMYKELKPNE